MGNFYTNITLRGPAQQDLIDYLNWLGRRAYVSQTVNEITAVYDEAAEDQDSSVLARLASELSRRFQCTALGVLDYDDDILWYQLYRAGTVVDTYHSGPRYAGRLPAGPSNPRGGNAERLCSAFGALESCERVESILRGSYLFASARHAELADALGLPTFVVWSGFNHIEAEGPHLFEGVEITHFLRTAV